MTSPLFQPLQHGTFSVSNRIAMAPMTRSRTLEGEVPVPIMATYYGQRASAGLIIAEGTPVSEVARGYSMTPGIYTKAQIEGWKKVTQAVHEKGGKIFVQLWHVGRRSHSSITGHPPLAPSAVKIADKVYGPLPEGGHGMIETEVPQAMTQEDIDQTIADFVQASKNAIEAGFDGVEIHGAHGYLFDQFLRRSSNIRTDNYGGTLENRMRFLFETLDAIKAAIGAERLALRISPFLSEGANGRELDEIIEETLPLVEYLNTYKMAYLHFSENIANFTPVPESFRKTLREKYTHPIMVCGKYTKESATAMLEAGYADMVAFGQPFICNPDLVERFRNNYPLYQLQANAHDTFYGGGAKGYTDYLTYEEEQAAKKA